jgi:acetyl-CoA acyltransferase
MSAPRRAVIVGGARTPFTRAFAELMRMDAIDLGVAAVRGLLERTNVPRDAIDAVVWGGVILPSHAPNVGREIVVDLKLDPRVEAHTVTRACASGLQAITDACAMIERGDADVVIAGGGDSTSNAAVQMPASFVHKVGPVVMRGKSGPMDYLRLAGKLSLKADLLPRQPRVAERSTGEVMGEAADKMADRNGISREAQDTFAVTSHHRAARAVASGRFADEIVPVTPPGRDVVTADTIVRADTSVEKLATLRPAFRKEGGTVTAGNASALTDGAAAVLVMSEERAAALGLRPLAAMRSWAYVGVDPTDQLLIGPAFAIPKALARAGLSLADVDRVDLHEAFAAQVLSVVKMLESEAFGQERLRLPGAVGPVDPDKLNVHGGSLALGHPFGATGARMVLTMAHELARTDARTAVLGICAAGGLGAAAVLERL